MQVQGLADSLAHVLQLPHGPFGHLQQRHVLFLRQTADGVRVCAVSIHQLPVLKLADGDGRHQHGRGAMAARRFHIHGQVRREGGVGIGVPLGAGIAVIVGELDQQQIAGTDMLLHRLQAAFRQEGFAGTARKGMVDDLHPGQELAQHLPPASDGGLLRRIGRRRRITADIDGHAHASSWTESSISSTSPSTPCTFTPRRSTCFALRMKKPARRRSGELAIMPASST